jgi:hypothetical protein
MGPSQRQELAVNALAGVHPVSRLAQEHEVSRKFVYQQTATAEKALNRAFFPLRTCRRPSPFLSARN